MDRDPSHWQQDPILRAEFCTQISLDEFAAWILNKLETTEGLSETLVGVRDKLREASDDEVQALSFPMWQSNIDPETNMAEFLYLQGYTDAARRDAQIQQQHAELREAAVRQGVFEDTGLEDMPPIN